MISILAIKYQNKMQHDSKKKKKVELKKLNENSNYYYEFLDII